MANLPSGYFKDAHGNTCSYKSEIRDGKLIVTREYILEPGKTTPRGEYPKLASEPKCVHPERMNCNSGEGYNRCEFMKCRSVGNWFCDSKP